MRGKKPSATLRSGELPMESITLSEGKQSSTRAKAPNPWQLQAPFPLTLPLSLREREHRTPRCDESRRSGLAKAQRTVLPLLGERAGVRGKKPSATQRSGELPMESATLSEGKQSPTPGEAPSA